MVLAIVVRSFHVKSVGMLTKVPLSWWEPGLQEIYGFLFWVPPTGFRSLSGGCVSMAGYFLKWLASFDGVMAGCAQCRRLGCCIHGKPPLAKILMLPSCAPPPLSPIGRPLPSQPSIILPAGVACVGFTFAYLLAAFRPLPVSPVATPSLLLEHPPTLPLWYFPPVALVVCPRDPTHQQTELHR